MLTLQESMEIHQKMSLLETESTEFTDQQIDAAEFYAVKLNPVSFNTIVTLYNSAEEALGSVEFEDADIAIAFLEELFDLDPDELAYLDSYGWVNSTDLDKNDDGAFDSLETDAQSVNNID